jgi:hypothetical protein
MSLGTRMPEPEACGNTLRDTTGSGPGIRSGGGAASQGGPAGRPERPVLRLAREPAVPLGTGAMAGRNDSLEPEEISPRLPPCQLPEAVHPLAGGEAALVLPVSAAP